MLTDTETRAHPDITLAKGTIHRPDEPRHFMKLQPINKTVSISRGGETLAISRNAMRLIEVGSDLYDPPVYIPLTDLVATLEPSDKVTHCPLKGDASYLNLPGDPNGTDIAWTYQSPLAFADLLKGYVAFFADRITIKEEAK